ncbi:hypothetical protein [Microvirga sp. TS319]|uniref:hypothetical protein n=1 Tax=Microvirga sp. TS319 TaxID=3241165 RepID=UPI00351AA929
MAQLISEMTLPRAIILLVGFALAVKLIAVLANAKMVPPSDDDDEPAGGWN